MRKKLILGMAVSVGFAQPALAQAVPGDAAVQNQWFTGTLEAPSPALPKPGILEVEPYAIYTRTYGAYGTRGDYRAAPNVDIFTSVTAMKYGITNRISVQALPSISHVANKISHYTGIGDLPIELEYRINNENNKTGFPSVTAAIGVTIPTGIYDNMRTPLSGFGSGAFTLKEQVLLQSLFDTPGGHPMRFRVYAAAYEAIGSTSVHNISVYGTSPGFAGRVDPGFSAVMGIGGGYALDQRWVIALDLVHKSARGFALDGADGMNVIVHSRSGRSARTSLAPALEYNISGNVGIIAGVDFSLSGHNSSAYFAPQIAISAGF